MTEQRASFKDGSSPKLFCKRQQRWLPVEEHLSCEHCAAPVFDENDEPVSFLCTYHGEKCIVQPDYVDTAEIGRGAPSRFPPDEDAEKPKKTGKKTGKK